MNSDSANPVEPYLAWPMKYFISYSRSVKDDLKPIVELLRAAKHDVWWDADIPEMADWWSTILDKIEWCQVFIFGSEVRLSRRG